MGTYLHLRALLEQKYLEAKLERDMRFYILCLLALETGARVSDLLKLDWSSIDFNTAEVIYTNTKSKRRQFQRISSSLLNHIKR